MKESYFRFESITTNNTLTPQKMNKKLFTTRLTAILLLAITIASFTLKKKEAKLPVVVFVYNNNCDESNKTLLEFNSKPVVDFYSKNFDCNKLDANKSASFLKAHHMTASTAPAILYFTPDGKLLQTSTGLKNRTELINEGLLAKTKCLNLNK